MAPGIRAFRSISFTAKAAAVTTAFLVPLGLLGTSFVQVSLEGVRTAELEQQGVRYVKALLPVIQASQNLRRAATAKADDLPQAQQQVDQAVGKLEPIEAELGDRLGPEVLKDWRALQDRRKALSEATGSDPTQVFETHSHHIDQLFEFLEDVSDASGLTLDPEVVTYYAMLAGVQDLPALAEQVGRVRGMGNAVLKAGAATGVQRDKIASAHSASSVLLERLRKDIGRAGAADADFAAEIRLDETVAGIEGLLKTVHDQVLVDKPEGDAVAFVAQANRTIDALYTGTDRVLAALDTRLADRATKLWTVMWGKLTVVVGCIVLAVYLLVAFYKVTQGGIGEVRRLLNEISNGNLTPNPRPWGKDEVAQLMNQVGATISALRHIVGQVRAGAAEIETASQEVASASMDLSRRTEESAAHLQRTSAAMGQIGATLRQTAESASGAAQMVVRNAEVASSGGAVVDEAVQTMGGIRDASTRIADIVGTIDGIAFQTNILALNAAVEAARAGEAGRGFAVVASEVRALAQRSGSAAREIKSLITASVEQVETGSRVVGQAGSTMKDIVGGAGRVRTMIEEISQGASHQTRDLTEVGQSVEQLDAMTQQNAALVEQTAAAAATLKDNAGRLNQEMAFFRLA